LKEQRKPMPEVSGDFQESPEEFLWLVMESLAEPITVIDNDFKIQWVNRSARELLRKGPHQLKSLLCYQCHHGRQTPCDGVEYPCPLKKLRESEEPLTIVHEHNTPDGGSRFFEIISTPFLSKDGTFMGIVEAQRDITERRSVEEALRESEERVRLLLNSTAEAVYGLDTEGKCTFCNPSCLSLLGYEREEDLLGGNMHELVHHTRADGTGYPPGECRIHEVIRKGRGVHVPDEVLWRADGSSFHAEYRAYPVFKGDRVIGVVVTFNDITERRQAEARLKMLTEELTRSNRELEQFAYVASHDLQSPLLAVASSLKLLKRHTRGKLDKEASDYIAYAQDRLSDMLTLIRSLLRYSRVESGGRKFKQVDTRAVMEKALTNLKVDLEERKANITTGPLPQVTGSATLLVQLFQNLLSNAIKFCQGTPRIHVSAEQRGRQWVFYVRDNGVGIAPEQTGRIFEIFQSLHERGMYSGSGIGLATCKKIVELHGGRIWVESQLKKGSTFLFTLPEREP
jgi:PAS domain S-box-containing protein